MIDPQLAGWVVPVTGANHGIGAATAQAFAAQGAAVFLASAQAHWLTGQMLYVGGGWRMSQ